MLTQISGDRVPLLLHRYSKLSNDKLDRIEDIADHALKGVVSSSALPLLTGLGVGFGIAGFSGMPIVGMAAAGYFLYSAVDSALSKGKQAEYIKDEGLLAHCLTEPNLIKYAEIVGPEAAIGEVLQAYQDGQPITAAARKLCIAMGKQPKRRTIATFLEEIQQLQTLPHDETAAAANNAAVFAIGPSSVGGTCTIHTAVSDLVHPVRSSYIAAPPRTGKGILTALAMQEFKRLYQKGTLYTYTPKQDPKENWYWQSSDQHFNPDLDQNPTRAAQSLYSMIRHWQSLPSAPDAPILFVIDELSATLGRLKSVKLSEVDDAFATEKRNFSDWFLDFLIHEASMRQSVDRFVWVLTPLATVGESGASASALKSLRNYTLASRENLKFADGGNATFAAPKITTDHPLLSRYQTIAYSHDSKTWLPIPTIAPNDLERFKQLNPSLKMWGDMPAAIGESAQWGATHPAAVFAAAYGQAFMDIESDSGNPERKVWVWAWQKLARFPEGLTRKRLWDDAPKSITNEVDRFTFDKYLSSAIEQGSILGDESGPLTQNPDRCPE